MEKRKLENINEKNNIFLKSWRFERPEMPEVAEPDTTGSTSLSDPGSNEGKWFNLVT